MHLRTLDDMDVAGRHVLVRADLNVPIRDGAVTDTARIFACAPTVRELIQRGAMPVVMSHLGRPGGRPVAGDSLRPVSGPLSDALGGIEVRFAADCIGAPARAAVLAMRAGDVLLLENLRFHPGEENDDPEFASALAELGEAYVNDAFSACHREHASVVGLPGLRESAAGRLLQCELESLERCLADPAHPYLAVLGGAKVSSKLGVLRALVDRVDVLALGGGMANTFLAATGSAVGRSLCEAGMADEANGILEQAARSGCRILLPEDVVVAREVAAHASCRIVGIGEVPEESRILDLGPRSVGRIVRELDPAATVVWNGPLGAAEFAGFEHGTQQVARAVARRTRTGSLVSVAGGGETQAALNAAGSAADFTYVSLGGGAFLEWLAGNELPGVRALSRAVTA
ncbi:MAG TPA: phosphoglycerate kinase [Gammaproteobacteria bacterium]|nr:phosphoglycerate kinase [Gammaproteobacteria bacterium]